MFKSLLAGLRTICADFPGARRIADPELVYSMADIAFFGVFIAFHRKQLFLILPAAVGQGKWDFELP